MTDIECKLKTSKAQIKFLQSVKRYVIFRGGIGSGKTRVLVYKAIANALKGRKGLFISNTYTQSRDVILATFMEALPLHDLVNCNDYFVNKSDMDIIIRGTYIHLRSAEQADKLRGINCSDVYIDEARNMKTDEVFLIASGRIRDVSDAQCFISTTPRGKDWVWLLSQDTESCDLIIQKTSDNPFLPKTYIDDLRKRYTTKFLAQECDAEIIEMAGEIINPSWFNLIEYIRPVEGVRYYDLAVSVKTSADYTASALCSFSGQDFCINHMGLFKLTYPELRHKIIEQAEQDGTGITIAIEQSGQQQAIIDDLQGITELKRFTIQAHKPTGDKLARAMPWVSRAECGAVKVCMAGWNKEFFEQCSSFTADDSHLHDDMVDAVSGGYAIINNQVSVTAMRIRI
jgi:predicted phage terminase large subunit-like protein